MKSETKLWIISLVVAIITVILEIYFICAEKERATGLTLVSGIMISMIFRHCAEMLEIFSKGEQNNER